MGSKSKSPKVRRRWKERMAIYKWCVRCSRTYLAGQVRIDPDYPDYPLMGYCPYLGCDGAIVGDSWDWGKIRERHPEYPEVPVKGVEYAI
jgi:hypothetical protein